VIVARSDHLINRAQHDQHYGEDPGSSDGNLLLQLRLSQPHFRNLDALRINNNEALKRQGQGEKVALRGF
jgi:hypothetical protein